jgi:hypothetical protein
MTTTSAEGGPLRLLAVGDVFLDRPDPMSALAPLRELLETADLVFGNSEGVYSDSTERAPNARGAQVSEPGNVKGLAGFTVLSLANNHIMDGGYAGLRQTADRLHEQGIRTVGAGPDLAAALAPAVIEAGGLRVGFLAFSSVFPGGYEARVGIGGLAPLRAHTLYLNASPDVWNPGAQPQILTAIDDADSALVEAAVQQARESTDLLIASVHWGDVTQPYALTEHEPQAAQLLADAGVDLVLGHHQHTLRGVGSLDRALVAYGLGHIACDLPGFVDDMRRETDAVAFGDEDACRRLLGDFGIYPRAGYPLLPFHPEARRTVVARFDLGRDGIVSAGLYPCRIGPDGEVRPLAAADPELTADLDYFRRCQERVPEPAGIVPEDDNGLAYWRITTPLLP